MKSAPLDYTTVVGVLLVYARPGAAIIWEQHLIAFDPEAGKMAASVEYTGWEWDDFMFWAPIPALPDPPKEWPT